MKKITLRILCAVLITALSASALLLSGCSGDGEAETSADVPATPSTEEITDTAEPAPVSTDTEAAKDGSEKPGGNPLEGLETVSEDLKVSYEEGGMTLREYKLFKTFLFDAEDGTQYNWLQFYNACIKGELDPSDPNVLEYAKNCLEYFEEYGSDPSRIAQAQSVIDAAKGLN